MKHLPKISSQIDEKLIHDVVKKNYATIAPFYFTLVSNWFVRAYKHYKDIDKFIIVIYLINKHLIFYRKNGLNIDYDTFYKDKTIEIEKIKILDISKDLQIPKETLRRKVLELEKKGVIKKIGKKIFIDRSTFHAAKARNTLSELSILLNEFNKLLKKEKLVNDIYDPNEITKSIKENFSFCWYQFNKFWFTFTNRWRSEVGDLETTCIGFILVINAVKNKKFKPKDSSIQTYGKSIMGSDDKGVNAMSISDITGIPRPTVVRKLKYLIDNKYLHINEKKLISFNIKGFASKKTAELRDKNALSLSNFFFRVFNQIKIINSN
tara:strand:+ start:1336 stop:2301 length:966 start_codon:yes stop_codon:yes gene_type:complete